MKQEQYNALVNEYVTSRRNKVDTLHSIWRVILNEFCLNSISDLERWLTDFSAQDSTSLTAINGRVASMNVMVRKLQTLGTPRNPEFVISSENHQNEAIASVLQSGFNEIKERIGWDDEMGRSSIDAILMGTGIAKSGLSSQYMYGETAWADSAPKGTEADDIYQGLPYGPTTEYQNPNVQDGWPTMIRVSPTDIFFNTGARKMSEVRRIYHRSRRCLADVKRDIRYDRKARSLVKGHSSTRLNEETDMYLTDVWDDVRGEQYYVDVVECFDLASRQFFVFCEDINIPLRDWTAFGLPINNPFQFFQPIEHPEFLWGIPPALVILSQVQSKNTLRMKLIDQINRDGKRIHLYDKNVPQDTNFIQKINSARDGEFIGVERLSELQGPFLQTIEFGGASPEVLKLMSIIEGDLAEMSGLTDAARNSYTGGDQTATEVAQRQEQQGLTTERFIMQNEKFQERCAGDLCQIMLSEWPEERVVKVTGPTPESIFWVPVERQRVLANFTIRIVAGSSERLDKNTLRRQWMEMLQQLMPLADRAAQDQQLQMQGYPPGPVNYMALIEETIGQYNPTLAHKVMNNRSSADLALRLMRNNGIAPIGMSPQMVQQIKAMAMQQMKGGSPELSSNAGQLPAPGGQQQPGAASMQMMPGAQMYQDISGNQTGRTQSELMRP